MEAKPERKLTGVTLTLTVSEARLLRSFARNVTGSLSGPHYVAYQLNEKLGKLGIGAYKLDGQIDLPSAWKDFDIEIGDTTTTED